MAKQKPLVMRMMQRKEGESGPPVGDRPRQASWIRPKRRLRMLRAHTVTFIRGPRDRSPWRMEGRLIQLQLRNTHQRLVVWSDRREQLRLPPRTGQADGWTPKREGR